MSAKVSNEKLIANRNNAEKSTGPRTPEGQAFSKWNALKHGLLSKEIVIRSGEGSENEDEYKELLRSLTQDWQPVGVLEHVLIERIATCYWRQARAARYENGEIRRNFVRTPSVLANEFPLDDSNPEFDAIRSPLSLPLPKSMETLLRYESAINRQLYQAINQLERLQRQRKGDLVPAPISVEISRKE